MSEAMLGEIRIFAGDYAPAGWAFCDGQQLAVRDHTALFSILQNRFGGDGRNTFGLPDLRGCAPMQHGAGTGLTAHKFAETGGAATVALTPAQMPSHAHRAQLRTNNAAATQAQAAPTNAVWGKVTNGYRTTEPDSNVALYDGALGSAGQGHPHENMQPYLVVSYIIALTGEYPTR